MKLNKITMLNEQPTSQFMAPPLPTEANVGEGTELPNRRSILRQSVNNGDYLDISDIGEDVMM